MLQEGVGVGVKQHGSCGVVASTVGDPVGKQHVVKLQNKGPDKVELFSIDREQRWGSGTVKQVDNYTTNILLHLRTYFFFSQTHICIYVNNVCTYVITYVHM